MATYYTLDEAAQEVRMSPDSLRGAIAHGDLFAKKTGKGGGGKYLIRAADLDRWFDGLVDA